MCVSVFASDWKATMIFSLSKALALTQLLQVYIHPALPGKVLERFCTLDSEPPLDNYCYSEDPP